MNDGHFNIDLQCLGLVLFVNVFAKLGLFCLHIEPFNVTPIEGNTLVKYFVFGRRLIIIPAPQKGRKVEASLASTGPNGLIGIPPFVQACVMFVGLVKVHFTIIFTTGIDIGKLVGDDVVVARIQACNDHPFSVSAFLAFFVLMKLYEK